jgi:hypothetical protein
MVLRRRVSGISLFSCKRLVSTNCFDEFGVVTSVARV